MLPPTGRRLSTPACRRIVSSFLTLLLGIVLPAAGVLRGLTPTASAAPLFANPSSTIFINEIHYDNTGTDAGEAVEIAGPAGTNLSGYTLVPYNGANGQTYTPTVTLSGIIPNQQGGYGALSFPLVGLQNGAPDGIVLAQGATVIQFLSYEGAFTATNGVASGMQSTDIGVSQVGTEPVGSSLQLTGNGTTYGDFTWASTAANTFGSPNTGQTFGSTDSAPTVQSTFPANGASGVAVGSNLTVSFSESVNATTSSFSVECPAGAPQTFALSASPSNSFTLDPSADLPANTTCTATVFANQISDVDANDPPDQMAANFVFSFTTADVQPPVATNVIINEVDSDTPGTDVLEFVELYDGGVGNTPLDGLVVVFYNGNGDVSYAAFDLDGFTTDAGGYFTLGNAGVSGVDLVFANGLLQNGQDAVALFEGSAANFPNGTGVTTTGLFDAFVYGAAPADAGLLPLLNAGQAQVNENAGGSGATQSSGRCPNGSGGGRNTASYTQGAPSAGASNNCPVPPQVRTIPEIQGNTGASPYDGVLVTTTGVVTARKTNGFFLQDAAGDNDAATSDAVFVFTSSAPTVAVGDAVQLTGTVDEFKSSSSSEPSTPSDPETLTEIVSPTNITVLSSGNPLPAPVDATALGVFTPGYPSRGDQLERYEAMRMSVAAITISHATNTFGEFWGVEPPRPRPFREPGIEAGDPIPAADDGPYAGTPPPAPPIFDGNFERVMVDSDDTTTPAGARRPAVNVSVGTLVSGIVGPLDYAFDNFRILLDSGVTPATAGGVTAATPVPARTAQEFTIGHANLENFGVSNANFAGRLNKASLAVRNVLGTPDILGVIEVFDLPTLQQLAAKINADAADPGVNYVAYLEESASTFADSQDVGYLVNTARVTVVGTPYQYHRDLQFTYLNEQPDLLHDRPAYVLTAEVPASGGGGTVPVTVVLNHTKSLIAVDSQQPRAGGGTEGARNREKRRLQAEDIADLIASLQNENLVVLGDLNAFDFNDGLTDVVGTLKGSPAAPENVVEPSVDRWNYTLTNLLSTLPASERYSYVFEGNAQTLDHVLVNNKMLARNTRFAYARYNADFPESLGPDTTRPEALSDHDAPVAYFRLPSADLSVSKSAASGTVLSGADATYTVTVANNSSDDAAGVVMTETIPAGTTLASYVAPAGWNCSATPAALVCNASSLPGNSSAVFTVVLTVDCATADGATVTNTASVAAATADSDPGNNSDSENVTVSNPAPVISAVSVDKPVLSPPNHQMVDVTVSYTVTDNCGTPTITLSVTSDEPENGAGDGDTAPDWEVVDANHVRLRAERAGAGDGRVYTITVTATDSAGNSSSQTVTVSVPKGNKK